MKNKIRILYLFTGFLVLLFYFIRFFVSLYENLKPKVNALGFKYDVSLKEWFFSLLVNENLPILLLGIWCLLFAFSILKVNKYTNLSMFILFVLSLIIMIGGMIGGGGILYVFFSILGFPIFFIAFIPFVIGSTR